MMDQLGFPSLPDDQDTVWIITQLWKVNSCKNCKHFVKLVLSSLSAVLPSPNCTGNRAQGSRHVNHVGLTPVVLTESTEALTYCATQGTDFSLANYSTEIPAVNSHRVTNWPHTRWNLEAFPLNRCDKSYQKKIIHRAECISHYC